MSGTDEHGEIPSEEVRYYAARAEEYDDWFFQRGRYDRGEAENARWSAEIEQASAALVALALDEADVVELA